MFKQKMMARILAIIFCLNTKFKRIYYPAFFNAFLEKKVINMILRSHQKVQLSR